MCTSLHALTVEYPRYPHSLGDEVATRRHTDSHYSENELYYILYSLTRTAALFEPENRSLGVISTRNILLNDRGHLKLVSRFSIPPSEDKPGSG